MKKILGIIAVFALLTFSGCDDIINELLEEEPVVTTVTVAETTGPETTSEETTAYTTELTEEPTTEIFSDYDDDIAVEYTFRTEKMLQEHFEKHGSEFGEEFGYETAEDYEKGANEVINNPEAMYKVKEERNDKVYYIKSTNEFVVLSDDDYIRTYFRPSAGVSYFERQ